MNREIRFRGMGIDGQWSYGNLAVITKKIGYIDPGHYISNSGGRPFAYQVRPETVGQYTGLKDRNGKEIYEGDILQCSLPVEIIDNGLNSLDSETINAKVVYENGCFMAEGKTVNYPWVLDGDKTILSWLCEIKAYDRYDTSIKVIGNIYENFELLEG